MADNEDDSGSTRTITAAEPLGTVGPIPATDCIQLGDRAPAASTAQTKQPVGKEARVPAELRSQPERCAGSGAPPVELLQSCPEEQNLLMGADLSGLGPDVVNATILYLQPDGSLVEGSGLSAEEQQTLLEQLSKQQVVQVSDSEAAQLLQQSQVVRTTPVQNTALDPSQLQQVINQVTKFQQQVQVPQQQVHIQVPQQTTTHKNASQQLKNVAQQVALQTSGSVQVVQRKTESVRLQIQVPLEQDLKPFQQKRPVVSQPHVKRSANGSMNSTQIIHIQPVVGQQGQQFFLQQNPGDPPFQLLVPSPAPMVGSLLPLVHKLTSQVSPGPTSAVGLKPVSPSVGVQTLSPMKTNPPTTTKPVSVSLIKPPANGTTVAPTVSRDKPAAQSSTTGLQVPTATLQTVAPPPTAKDREKEKDKGKKLKKREKKAVKVQTRSGRVSRPPKYKAKDYKFIKTEDLADSHQSDSDDYSDMSMEEEGEAGRKEDSGLSTSDSLTYSHKSRSHRCQTCEKAYIGMGGLNRHYKLNPTHGEPRPSSNTPHSPPDSSPSHESPSACVKGEEDKKEGRKEDKLAAVATNSEKSPAAGLKGFHHRGPGRPRGRGRGRGRGRSLGQPVKVPVGLIGRRGRRGRPPKLGITMATAEQQLERRRERLQELVEQCEDEQLMDIVLPRLTKVLSLWELLLAKVGRGGLAHSRFPDIYREFESLQTQVRQAAQDYIVSPQGGALEVRNIEVARSLGILDEVKRMKVVPGASPSGGVANKNVRYMENSKMLPPSKRFKMENSVPVCQNGLELPRPVGPPAVQAVTPENSVTPVASVTPENTVTSVTSTLKSCLVSVSPLVIPPGSNLLSTSADSSPRSSGPAGTEVPSTQADSSVMPMEVTTGEDQGEGPPHADAQVDSEVVEQDQVLHTRDSEETLDPQSTADPQISGSSSVQTHESTPTDPSGTKELQEGQEIYIQTEGLTVEVAEPGSEGIVIVNGPDGTTMHIQTPEGVPLEAVQALLGIEASDGAKAPQ